MIVDRAGGGGVSCWDEDEGDEKDQISEDEDGGGEHGLVWLQWARIKDIKMQYLKYEKIIYD